MPVRMASVFVMLALMLATSLACSPRTSSSIEGSFTALDFGPEGDIYLVSAEAGEVYRSTSTGLEVLARGWNRPAGIAALPDGRVCVSRFSDDPPIERESLVSCHDGTDWHKLVSGIGNGIGGINGMAHSTNGLWLAAWRATPIESRDGSILVVANGAVVREVPLSGVVPQFLAVQPDGTAYVSAWLEDATGFTGGVLLRIRPDGRVDRVATDLDRPSGLAYEQGRGLWIADFATGVIYLAPEAFLTGASTENVQPTEAIQIEPNPTFQTHERVLGLAHSNDRLCAAHSEGYSCFDAQAPIQNRGN